MINAPTAGRKGSAIYPFRNMIEDALFDMRIDHRKWMQKGDKGSIEHFIEAIEDGSMGWDFENRSRDLYINVAVVSIRYRDPERGMLELRNTEIIYPNGAIHHRDQKFSGTLGEKMPHEETPLMAAIRGMKEELGSVDKWFASHENYDLVPNGYEELAGHPSEFYPPFRETYQRRKFFCPNMPDWLYRPEGYLSHEKDKKNRFVWKPFVHT